MTVENKMGWIKLCFFLMRNSTPIPCNSYWSKFLRSMYNKTSNCTSEKAFQSTNARRQKAADSCKWSFKWCLCKIRRRNRKSCFENCTEWSWYTDHRSRCTSIVLTHYLNTRYDVVILSLHYSKYLNMKLWVRTGLDTYQYCKNWCNLRQLGGVQA